MDCFQVLGKRELRTAVCERENTNEANLVVASSLLPGELLFCCIGRGNPKRSQQPP